MRHASQPWLWPLLCGAALGPSLGERSARAQEPQRAEAAARLVELSPEDGSEVDVADLIVRGRVAMARAGEVVVQERWRRRVQANDSFEVRGVPLRPGANELVIRLVPEGGPATRVTRVVHRVVPAAPQGPGADPTHPVTSLEAPSHVLVLVKGARLEVGWKVLEETQAAEVRFTRSTAVVGEREDQWLVELTDSTWDPLGKDLVMGLAISKADGKVARAIVGRPWSRGRAIAVRRAAGSPSARRPQAPPRGTPGEVRVKAGTFKATRYASGGTTTWEGAEGLTRGHLLKSEGPYLKVELDRGPIEVELDLGLGERPKGVMLAYDDGTEQVWTEQRIVRALSHPGGLAASKHRGVTARVTGVRVRARPRLEWPSSAAAAEPKGR